MARKTQEYQLAEKVDQGINRSGAYLVKFFHYLGLFAIGAATVWASVYQFIGMFEKQSASIEDILTLFIYLEIGAMVGIYFKTTHLPVRYLIYIAITALTKLIVTYTGEKHEQSLDYLITAGAIVLLALSVMVLRFGSHKFPSIKSQLFNKNKQ